MRYGLRDAAPKAVRARTKHEIGEVESLLLSLARRLARREEEAVSEGGDVLCWDLPLELRRVQLHSQRMSKVSRC